MDSRAAAGTMAPEASLRSSQSDRNCRRSVAWHCGKTPVGTLFGRGPKEDAFPGCGRSSSYLGGMPVSIRLADVDDLDAIARFADDVVPAHYTPILGEEGARAQLDWWTADRMKPAVEAGHVHVAVAGRAIVGVVQTGILDGDCVVWKLYLAPAFRGQSIGADLLRHAIAPFKEVADHVLVEHFAGNTKAADFYERHGWRVVRTEAARSGDPHAAVVWRRLAYEA